jgi:protein LTV1
LIEFLTEILLFFLSPASHPIMGKKKQFAPKDGSSKFVLMHRSQRDADYGQDGASDLVLYPVGSGASESSSSADLSTSVTPMLGKDHVNHLGLPNDGYDYEKHMRSIETGGVFIGKTGKVAQAAVLPPEAMASTKEEHGRLFEAITISAHCMDADISSALFDADYDNGELDDDIVLQASAADNDEAVEAEEAGRFDYDAHIAKMIQASEKNMGLIEELSSDGEGSEYSDDDGNGSETGDGTPSIMGSVLGVDGAQRAKIDLDFEKVL